MGGLAGGLSAARLEDRWVPAYHPLVPRPGDPITRNLDATVRAVTEHVHRHLSRALIWGDDQPRKGTCIPSSAVAAQVLQILGIEAEAIEVFAIAVNEQGLADLAAGRSTAEGDCRGIYDPRNHSGFFSHVVASVRHDGRRMLVDAAADQMDAPGWPVKPLSLEVSDEFDALYSSGRGPFDLAGMEWLPGSDDHATVGYRPTLTRNFATTPIWQDDKVVGELIAAVLTSLIEEHGTEFVRTDWQPPAGVAEPVPAAVRRPSRLEADFPVPKGPQDAERSAAAYRELTTLSPKDRAARALELERDPSGGRDLDATLREVTGAVHACLSTALIWGDDQPRKGTCLPSTVVMVEVLRRLGIASEPCTVHALAVNDQGFAALQREDVPVGEDMRFSGALNPYSDPAIGPYSHVVVRVRHGGRDLLVDPSADQLATDVLDVRPNLMELSPDFDQLYDCGREGLDLAGYEWLVPGDGEGRVGYRPTFTTDHVAAPAWTQTDIHEQLVEQVLGNLREAHGAAFFAPGWRPGNPVLTIPSSRRFGADRPPTYPKLGGGRSPDEVAALYRELELLPREALAARLRELAVPPPADPRSNLGRARGARRVAARDGLVWSAEAPSDGADRSASGPERLDRVQRPSRPSSGMRRSPRAGGPGCGSLW